MGFDPLPSTPAEPAVDTPHLWTVSELNHAIRQLLEQSLRPVWLRGEIGNITIHRSGHVYFSLKDERSQVPAVFFRGANTARELQLRTGVEVEVWGRVTVYEPRGAYQVIVERIRPCGIGSLQQRFEELKRRLRTEGLFDPERKRPVPVLPKCVGVVTSPEGAALRDFLQIINRRFPNMHIRVYPTPVQGQGAARELAAGIAFLNANRCCDVIVVTRGGGSLEDLWQFNDEILARAVAASAIPVVSAVGHERDFTICDFVSDMRVPTPSAAAELVTAGKGELQERIANLNARLAGALRLRLANYRGRVERVVGSGVFREPRGLARMYQQRLDELGLRMAQALSQTVERARLRLGNAAGQLKALSPKRVLRRGYAILLDREGGRALRRADETSPGRRVRGILGSGEVELTVETTHPDAAH